MIDYDHDPRVWAIVGVAAVALALAYAWYFKERRKLKAERKRWGL